jgi:hypothetical protein
MVPNAFKEVHLHNARAGMFRFEMLPTVLREFKKMCFFNVKKHSQIWFFINITKSNASISNFLPVSEWATVVVMYH